MLSKTAITHPQYAFLLNRNSLKPFLNLLSYKTILLECWKGLCVAIVFNRLFYVRYLYVRQFATNSNCVRVYWYQVTIIGCVIGNCNIDRVTVKWWWLSQFCRQVYDETIYSGCLNSHAETEFPIGSCTIWPGVPILGTCLYN